MIEFNQQILARAVADCRTEIAGQRYNGDYRKRWMNALTKAAAELDTNDLWSFDEGTCSLYIHSSSGDKIYLATKTACQCAAFNDLYPYYHRATVFILERYLQLFDKEMLVGSDSKRFDSTSRTASTFSSEMSANDFWTSKF